MVRRSPRLQAALERLPNTRGAWNMEDIQTHLTAAMDWPTLMAVSRLNRWGREVVRIEIRRRIKGMLKIFVPDEFIDEFIDILNETRGGIGGSFATELLLINSDWYNPMTDPANLEQYDAAPMPSPDLNVMIPEGSFGQWSNFLRKIGYHHHADLGVGTCYSKAGVTRFVVFCESEPMDEEQEPMAQPNICISSCSRSIIRTALRSPWSVQTNLITADTVYCAFPHLTYNVVCVRNTKSHPLCGPCMRIPDFAYFEPYNGHWEQPCGKHCPAITSRRRKPFRAVASFRWTLVDDHLRGREEDLKVARSSGLPKSFGVFCYNDLCTRGEEWLIPWNAPQGRLIPPPKGHAPV